MPKYGSKSKKAGVVHYCHQNLLKPASLSFRAIWLLLSRMLHTPIGELFNQIKLKPASLSFRVIWLSLLRTSHIPIGELFSQIKLKRHLELCRGA